MKFKVIEDLVNTKLENFVSEYRNSNKLFENKDVQNGLLHPGEYGMYKERLISKLFEFTLPKKYTCGTGFVTNCKREITTQCDIILFDAQNAPFLELEGGRFFPQEVVYAIGEVKSKLSKKDFLKALIKLAQAKKIRPSFPGLTSDGVVVNVNPEIDQYQSIATFLICDEISGWDEKLINEINEAYEKNGIDVPYRINVILSLKNGVLSYDIHNALVHLELVSRELGKEPSQVIECGTIATPFFKSATVGIIPLECEMSNSTDEIRNLKEFLVLLNNFLQDLKSYYPEPGQYLYNRDR